MRTFSQKQNPSHRSVSPSLAPSNHRTDPIPHLQRTLGNQAVQRFIQRKLTVNTPGDRYEQEADHIADQVMRTSASPCACGASCPKCKQNGSGPLQMKRAHEHDSGNRTAPPVVNEVITSPGQPLDLSTRQFMESRFGHDFSGVRVHADAKASDSARQIEALAYTAGRDIVFAAGRYEPATAAGRHLLAHELAHVVQQTGGGSGAIQRQPDPSMESDFQLSPFRPTDLRENASPLLASALGSTTIDRFPTGSAKIPKEGEDALRYAARQILYFIRTYPLSTVHIAGHTDRVGKDEKNLTLGQDRADVVKAFLEGEGVPAGLLSTESKGESEPVVPTKNEQPEPRNRRVNVFFRVQKSNISFGIDYTLKPPERPTFEKPTVIFPPKLPPGYDPNQRRIPYRDPAETEWWDRAKENQRIIDEIDRKYPRKNKSLSEAAIDVLMDEIFKPILKELPISDDLRKKAEGGIRKGLEAGSEKACEAVIDATGAGSSEKEALKAACKAALKQKPAETGKK
ncbi:eCIS core domain-containing protein [Candidatus Manganitrophus noduliformans]|uniref:DUF4157 domain-containing protein n=1 Tax=Candidatus Manganitrophus noduliformans TaxID=2606439 RepID=A0A7X6DNW5_9BACT|nr:DUF4157 domain-containing protein [Candidatus Manganitrophus noduliformans]NKE70353.1 DUF4157 domain-containing protein [Candidatus Manganitrophus noduliformans]